MSVWYRTGTVTVSAGSPTVVGTGTAWIANVRVGDGIKVGDGTVYEIQAITADDAITLAENYSGTTGAGLSYAIVPTRGFAAHVANKLQAAIDRYDAAVDGALRGRFPAGSAAEPSIADIANIGTGIFFPAANKMGLAINGVQRALLSSTALQLDVPLTGTAVQQSSYDRTAGRVLLNGAHGLGSDLSSLSGDLFDDANKTGSYYARPPASSGASDMPSENNWHVQKMTRSAGFAFALAANQHFAASTNMWFTMKHDGIVGDWRKLFDTGNFVGSVSDDAATAIIETGSNANGKYTKFADGTLICWTVTPTLTTDSYSVNGFWASPSHAWTFPAAFIGAPVVLPGAQRDGGSHFHWAGLSSGAYSATGVSAFLMASSSGSTGEIHLLAIGRWK